MKKKNIIIAISMAIAFAVLMAVLSGCSLGHFAFNFKQNISHGMNFNEKRNLREEFNFKDAQRNPGSNRFKNKHMFKQNVENIPYFPQVKFTITGYFTRPNQCNYLWIQQINQEFLPEGQKLSHRSI